MVSNFFEDLQTRKQNLKEYAIKAHEFGWIDEQRKAEIIQKLDNDTLTIGVIGQMKCGKSTFLNAFVFEDDILPAATTPMTAALSVIKYGHEKKIDVEFYTQDEWVEQEEQAKRDMYTISNEVELAKVTTAKKLVEKSSALGGSVSQYLGKKKEDTLDNLIEYVGANGKYVSITKSVTIYSPKEYLKGVELVDTPGFNDPIVSREERTKAFLKRADVVLLMLYAGQPFDATDRTILFQNVKSCGIGKVIIGVNKYDIPYQVGETAEEIQSYVKEQITKACRNCEDSRLVEILQDTTPILLSANMALLSQLPLDSIVKEKSPYKFHWDRGRKIFEISSQKEFRERSRIDDLTTAIKDMVEKEKGQILFAKPLNAILAAGHACKAKVEKELGECESKIVVYSTPDSELEDRAYKLQRAKNRMDKKINNLVQELNDNFDTLTQRANHELEDIVDASCNRMREFVRNWRILQSPDVVQNQIQAELSKLQTRSLKRSVEKQEKLAKLELENTLEDFFAEADEIMLKFLPEFDQRDFLKEAQREIRFQINNEGALNLGAFTDNSEDTKWKVWSIIINGIGALLKRGLQHGEIVNELEKQITQFCTDFDPNQFTKCLTDDKDRIIEQVKKKYQQELLDPIQQAFDEVSAQSLNKEIELENLRKQKEELLKQKEMVVGQITEMESLMKTSQE